MALATITTALAATLPEGDRVAGQKLFLLLRLKHWRTFAKEGRFTVETVAEAVTTRLEIKLSRPFVTCRPLPPAGGLAADVAPSLVRVPIAVSSPLYRRPCLIQ